MPRCTKCDTTMDAQDLLSGDMVYAEMAGGQDRDDILSSYSGIQYGSATIFCAECLDSTSDCDQCGGTGVVESDPDSSDGSSDGPSPCPNCDGTGLTKPDLLRDCCRF